MQAVVCEKDVRFREQVQKHEEELLKVSAQVQSDGALQQVQPPTRIDMLLLTLKGCLTMVPYVPPPPQDLRVAQRHTEELEEALRSRLQVLDMLQQELNSADQQKQVGQRHSPGTRAGAPRLG